MKKILAALVITLVSMSSMAIQSVGNLKELQLSLMSETSLVTVVLTKNTAVSKQVIKMIQKYESSHPTKANDEHMSFYELSRNNKAADEAASKMNAQDPVVMTVYNGRIVRVVSGLPSSQDVLNRYFDELVNYLRSVKKQQQQEETLRNVNHPGQKSI